MIFGHPCPVGRTLLCAFSRRKIVLVLLATAYSCLFPHEAPAQSTSPPHYFRYFEAKVSHCTAAEMDSLGQHLPAPTMKIVGTCNESGAFLIAVDAMYPKRINEIRNEIETVLNATFSAERIAGIEKVPVNRTLNYCE